MLFLSNEIIRLGSCQNNEGMFVLGLQHFGHKSLYLGKIFVTIDGHYVDVVNFGNYSQLNL